MLVLHPSATILLNPYSTASALSRLIGSEPRRLWYNFLYFQYLAIPVLGSNIVIKDVDEAVYRSLKGEAIKAGLKVGDAASQAFRLWVQQRSLGRVRDREAMRKASRDMDLRRAKIGTVKGWSSTDVIRKWRELRRP
jgi:hypothetical protein